MSKERQIGPLEQIRADHVKRYLFAAELLRGKKVLDLACGCGYGSWLLQEAGNEVTGVDISEEAIGYAKRYYQGPTYLCQKAEDTEGEWDAIVSFETLEHLEDPLKVLKSVKASIVVASVPNQELMPFKPHRFEGDVYPHRRHYTPVEFHGLLHEAGYSLTSLYCQQDKRNGKIFPGTNGKFLVYVGVR